MRNGITQFDLVGVTAILALLTGLTLPAIQKVRGEADRARCAAHLKTIGHGVQSYIAANEGLLPFNQLSPPYGSWNLQLLPYIGEEKLAREYNPAQDWWASVKSLNRTLIRTRIPMFQCPAAPHPDRVVLTKDPEDEGKSFPAAPTDFVGSAGAYYGDNQQKNLHPGAMHHRTLVKRLRLTDIADGASSTLFVVEMADKPNSWRAGKLADDRSDKPQMPALSGQWAAPNWNHLRSHTFDGVTQFGPCAVNCSNGAAIYGFHTEGANVLFVDGSVRLLRAGLSQEMLIALVSFSGGELLSANDY